MIALGRQAEKEGRPGARLLIVTGQPDRNLQQQVHELAATRGVKTDWFALSGDSGSEEGPVTRPRPERRLRLGASTQASYFDLKKSGRGGP